MDANKGTCECCYLNGDVKWFMCVGKRRPLCATCRTMIGLLPLDPDLGSLGSRREDKSETKHAC